jgi:hypothetical protein
MERAREETVDDCVREGEGDNRPRTSRRAGTRERVDVREREGGRERRLMTIGPERDANSSNQGYPVPVNSRRRPGPATTAAARAAVCDASG